MTKEELEVLAEYESDFRMAIGSNFVRMDATRFNKIADLYAKHCGVELTKSQRNCSTCRLNALKTLGTEYFNWKKHYEEIKDEAPAEEPKKKGRPRKIDLGE